MKKFSICFFVFCLLLSVSVPVASATSAVDAKQGSTSYSIDSETPLLGTKQLIDNAKAVFLYEINSGTLMYAWNADEPVYPASLVKIMTALLAAEKGNLADIVTVKDSVISTVPYNAVSADLQPDEEMSLESLLYCMMVGSANDAAAVIADHISGSQDAFVNEMNAYANQLGCTKTNFTNAHGLHHENQVTTARDMAKILSVAMKNETFYKLFSTVRYSVPATNKSEKRDLVTGNFLMNTDSMDIYLDERVTGGRTGVTEDGRRCLAASAEGNGLTLISIIMGADSVIEEDGYTTTVYGGYNETSALFDKGLDGYKAVQVLYPNQTVTQCSVIDGQNDVILGSNTAVVAVLPAEANLDDLSFRYSNAEQIHAPVAAGDTLSSVEVWYGSTCVANAELFAMNSVDVILQEQVSNDTEKVDDQSRAILITIAIGVGAVLLFLLVIRVIPRIRRCIKSRHLKKYRRNRRRSR